MEQRGVDETGIGDAGVGGSLAPGDRSLAAAAHLSVVVPVVVGILISAVAGFGFGGYVTGPSLLAVLCLGATLGVWAARKNSRPGVGFQALQAFWWGLVWLVGSALGWAISVPLALVYVGVPLVIVMFFFTVGLPAYSVYAAYRIYRGDAFRYPYLANRISSRPRNPGEDTEGR